MINVPNHLFRSFAFACILTLINKAINKEFEKSLLSIEQKFLANTAVNFIPNFLSILFLTNIIENYKPQNAFSIFIGASLCQSAISIASQNLLKPHISNDNLYELASATLLFATNFAIASALNR